MPELLLELGCDELPASFVRKAYTELEAAIVSLLKEARIEHGDSGSMGTPRRLIVHVQGVASRQPDATRDQRGPALPAAFDTQGKPTKALEGFCRSQGVEVSDVRKEGDYVWITKAIPGRPTAEVLAELFPQAIRSLGFDKSMRWGHLRIRFARPIRWILAAFDGKAVSFELEGIAAGLESRGHRFIHPESFTASTFQELLEGLLKRSVEPDPAKREQAIREGAIRVASGAPEMADSLVEENVFLTEWPVALESKFRDEYLELPVPVLATAMAKHEKFFPVRDENSRLTNRFVSIRNGGVDEVVGEGNSWVLNARFNDAKFFYDEDRKSSLAEFLERTKGIVYQDKLGTVHQRAYRLAELAATVAEATGANEEEQSYAREAGRFAKADLTTGLVSELPALQGLIGGEYARREGMPDPICWAIASHYELNRNPVIDCEGARTAVRLLMTDNLDKLAGYLGIGLAPSGSSDPFGLRRAATLLIEAALRWPTPFAGFRRLFECATESYRQQGFELQESFPQLAEAFRSRYESIFASERYDIVQAAMLDDYAGRMEVLDPQGVQYRISALQIAAQDVPFVQTATRPLNIVAAAVNKGIPFGYENPLEQLSHMDSVEGTALAESAQAAARTLQANPQPRELVLALKGMETPINRFFDSTLVMVEDEEVRHSRLSLLHGVNLLLRQVGDFSKIVVEG